jgi:two-component system LytT family response regulator
MRTVIVDDEEKSRKTLSSLLKRYCADIDIVGESGSVEEAVSVIKAQEPDLVFIDIHMPDGTGFDVLEQFSNRNFNIIFVTAFEEHALKAFRFSALHYLLKPINFLELQLAVERFRKLHLINKTEESQKLEIAKNVYSKGFQESIVLPSLDGFSVVKVNDIVRCEADSNYTRIVFTNGKAFMASRNLSHFEDLFSGLSFVRIHHKHLINLSQVKRYLKGRGGSVEMTDGYEVEVSVRKKEEFLSAMAGFARGAG